MLLGVALVAGRPCRRRSRARRRSRDGCSWSSPTTMVRNLKKRKRAAAQADALVAVEERARRAELDGDRDDGHGQGDRRRGRARRARRRARAWRGARRRWAAGGARAPPAPRRASPSSRVGRSGAGKLGEHVDLAAAACAHLLDERQHALQRHAAGVDDDGAARRGPGGRARRGPRATAASSRATPPVADDGLQRLKPQRSLRRLVEHL